MLSPVENRHRQKLHRESRLRLSPRNLPPRRPNPLKRQPPRSPRGLRSKPSEAMDSRVTRWSLLCAHSARFVSRSDQYANDRDGSEPIHSPAAGTSRSNKAEHLAQSAPPRSATVSASSAV